MKPESPNQQGGSKGFSHGDGPQESSAERGDRRCESNNGAISYEIYKLEVMQEKTLSKWRSVFGVVPFRDGALNPGIVANRAQVGIAKGSLNAGHSLGRVKGRYVGTDFHSCFASINRWCTNAMLARSNARDRLQKFGRSTHRADAGKCSVAGSETRHGSEKQG